MKLPSLFRRERENDVLEKVAADRADRLLAETLRLMGQVFSKLADLVEEQRLQKSGTLEQDRYLERLDPAPPKAEK
jgi:hypothetical protein